MSTFNFDATCLLVSTILNAGLIFTLSYLFVCKGLSFLPGVVSAGVPFRLQTIRSAKVCTELAVALLVKFISLKLCSN